MASFKKNLVLSLGPITTSVDLFPVTSSARESSLSRICPDHKIKLKQRYYCPTDDEHIVEWGSWYVSGETDEGTFAVPDENRPKPQPVDSLGLSPVPTDQIEAVTLEGSAMYYLKPSSEAFILTWTMFYRAAQQKKTSLVARGSLRTGSHEKLFKLTTFNGYLVLREIYFPSKINNPPSEPVTATVDRDTQKLFNQLMENVTTDFDKLDTESDAAKAMQEWLKTGEKLEVVEGKPKQNVGQEAKDLNDILMEAVKNAG